MNKEYQVIDVIIKVLDNYYEETGREVGFGEDVRDVLFTYVMSKPKEYIKEFAEMV